MSIIRFIHKPLENVVGKVSTIEVYGDGYVAFGNEDGDYSDEFSIPELKDIIDEATYALDHPIADPNDDYPYYDSPDDDYEDYHDYEY